MSEPAKGAWRIGRTGVGSLPSMAIAQQMAAPDEASYQASAILPASAQVVEMPTAPGEPPCVYVRGQRARWRVLWHSPYWDNPVEADAPDEGAARRIYAQWREKRKGYERVELTCEVVVEETRTKEAAGE